MRDEAGKLVMLKPGMQVTEGQEIVTAAGSQVELQFADGGKVSIGADRDVLLNNEFFANTLIDHTEASVSKSGTAETERVIQALNAGKDPFNDLDPTAAGIAGGQGNEGPTFVRLLRISEGVSGTELLGTSGPGDAGFAFVANSLATGETPDTAPTVTITEDINNDGYLNANELNPPVDVRIGLPPEAVAGDTLTVTDGKTTQNIVLTPEQIAAGHIDTSFAPPADGEKITVTAHVTDIAGNVSPDGSDSAIVDLTAANAPTVTLTSDTLPLPGGNDGLLNKAELAAGTPAGTVAATVTLDATGQADLAAGGSVHVDVAYTGTGAPANVSLDLHLDTAGHLVDAAGQTYGYSGGVITLAGLAAPGDGNTVTVTATETDLAGNTSAPG
ncbi:MAG: retention module-containing protein, partial [Zoogloea sp.]|nr:retention module-containing protein [Zoogloea sp.]